eukprot:scaffold249182_cov24-Tisochrysis_lutea.AAC.1
MPIPLDPILYDMKLSLGQMLMVNMLCFPDLKLCSENSEARVSRTCAQSSMIHPIQASGSSAPQDYPIRSKFNH